MKHLSKIMGAVLSLVLLFSLFGCGEPHEHVWSDWMYDDENGHYRICTADGCTEPRAREYGQHDGTPCTLCAAFRVLAFYAEYNGDQAHESFDAEADDWFQKQAEENNFIYESTCDWSLLNDAYVANFDVLIFLDSRPEGPDVRAAFERYMEKGGAWMGFHFAAFALGEAGSGGSAVEQDWDWYHEEFLGSGQYTDNTWQPTAETLRVETHDHPATEGLPDTFVSAPCEWYSWEHDLRENPNITVLASLDSSTFPVGDNPGEIWYDGYYPVVWANNNYRMIYFNMGHNLVQYGQPYRDLSHTFDCEEMAAMVLNGLFGLVG